MLHRGPLTKTSRCACLCTSSKKRVMSSIDNATCGLCVRVTWHFLYWGDSKWWHWRHRRLSICLFPLFCAHRCTHYTSYQRSRPAQAHLGSGGMAKMKLLAVDRSVMTQSDSEKAITVWNRPRADCGLQQSQTRNVFIFLVSFLLCLTDVWRSTLSYWMRFEAKLKHGVYLKCIILIETSSATCSVT